MQTDRSRDIAITGGGDKITKDEINPVAKREKERVVWRGGGDGGGGCEKTRTDERRHEGGEDLPARYRGILLEVCRCRATLLLAPV